LTKWAELELRAYLLAGITNQVQGDLKRKNIYQRNNQPVCAVPRSFEFASSVTANASSNQGILCYILREYEGAMAQT